MTAPCSSTRPDQNAAGLHLGARRRGESQGRRHGEETHDPFHVAVLLRERKRSVGKIPFGTRTLYQSDLSLRRLFPTNLHTRFTSSKTWICRCSLDATPWTGNASVYCTRHEEITSAIALTLTIGALVFIVEAAPQPSAARAGGRLTIEQLIDIRHPSNAVWSPDGRHVAFLSERAGIANIFVADVTGSSSAATRPLTKYADGQGGAFFWSADSSRVYFARSGDLWQVAASGGEPSAVWTTPQAENGITPSPDGTRVAFVRSTTAAAAGAAAAPAGRGGRGGGAGGGDLMIRTLADGKESLVLRGEGHVDRRPRLVARRQGDCVQRQQPHHPPRADAGSTPARRSSTRSARTCRARPTWSTWTAPG